MAYRDKKTGRFASKASYNRSKAHGGTRFVRTQFVERERPAPPIKIKTSKTTIKSLSEYYEDHDDREIYDDVELTSGLDYGEEG